MPAFLKNALSWFVDALPDLSNLILVLVGVIMSLPKLAERIEDHAIARYTVGIACLVLGLAGFVAGIAQRRQATQQMTTLVGNANILVGNTNTLVTNTNNVLSMVALIQPQVAAANTSLADLKSELRVAYIKNDPGLVANLQAKVAEAQKRSDDASRDLADLIKKIDSPETPLKAQGLQMAKEINDWIDAMSHDPRSPPPSKDATMEELQAWVAYGDVLNTEWDAKFGTRPLLMVSKLHAD